jgi:hypothetical protein
MIARMGNCMIIMIMFLIHHGSEVSQFLAQHELSQFLAQHFSDAFNLVASFLNTL